MLLAPALAPGSAIPDSNALKSISSPDDDIRCTRLITAARGGTLIRGICSDSQIRNFRKPIISEAYAGRSKDIYSTSFLPLVIPGMSPRFINYSPAKQSIGLRYWVPCGGRVGYTWGTGAPKVHTYLPLGRCFSIPQRHTYIPPLTLHKFREALKVRAHWPRPPWPPWGGGCRRSICHCGRRGGRRRALRGRRGVEKLIG